MNYVVRAEYELDGKKDLVDLILSERMRDLFMNMDQDEKEFEVNRVSKKVEMPDRAVLKSITYMREDE